MNTKQIKCRNCGAPLKYEPGMTFLKCAYCGTEYTLQLSASEQTVQDIRDSAGCLFRTLVPPQWRVRTCINDKIFSIDAAVCLDLILTSPRGSMIIMSPFAYYRDTRSQVLGNVMDGVMDPITMLRHRHRRPMEEYAAGAVQSQFPSSHIVSCHPSTEEEEVLKQRAQDFSIEAGQKLKSKADMSWASYEFRLTDGDGQEMTVLFASLQAARREQQRPEPARTEGAAAQPEGVGSALKAVFEFGMNGGLLNKKLGSGSHSGLSLPDLSAVIRKSGSDWGSLFDITLLYREGPISSAHALLNAFIANMQYGTRYYQMQEEEANRATQIVLDGQRQRQQNAFNGWQRIHQTQAETSDIINKGYAQRSATMDRVYHNISEGVRGVNTYETAGGKTYEADVKYDHIYQNGSTFVGSTDGSISLGPDWVENKRK